jgi:hypothetical protein
MKAFCINAATPENTTFADFIYITTLIRFHDNKTPYINGNATTTGSGIGTCRESEDVTDFLEPV